MKNFNTFIEKLNFKKIITVYIILAVVIGLLSLGFLAYVFKDKLIFAYDFNRLSERIERGKLGIDSARNELTSLAEQSSDIVDILILDKDNKVIFSAKKSEFGNDKFTLQDERDKRGGYLTYLKNPNISFKLMNKDDLMLLAVFLGHEKKINHHYKDKNFFRNNFNSKKIYLLSYAVDRTTGEKVYFISDVHPVPNGELYTDIVGTVGIVFIILYWILLSLWVYQNARKSKTDAVLWGAITLITNLAGLFVYLIYKQSGQICYKCNTFQSRNNVYCRYCGVKIANTCRSCGRIINEGDNFCNNCGSKITDE